MITELVDGRSTGTVAKGMKVHMPGAGAASSSSSAHKSNNDGATAPTNNQDEAANDDDGNGEEKTRQMVTSQGCSRVFIVKGTLKSICSIYTQCSISYLHYLSSYHLITIYQLLP